MMLDKIKKLENFIEGFKDKDLAIGMSRQDLLLFLWLVESRNVYDPYGDAHIDSMKYGVKWSEDTIAIMDKVKNEQKESE